MDKSSKNTKGIATAALVLAIAIIAALGLGGYAIVKQRGLTPALKTLETLTTTTPGKEAETDTNPTINPKDASDSAIDNDLKNSDNQLRNLNNDDSQINESLNDKMISQ